MDNTTEGTWDSLPVKLNHNILQTLDKLKFTHMTPVQVNFVRLKRDSSPLGEHTVRLMSPIFSSVRLYPAVYE